ncbi:hypothetical protein [Streptomyces sp. NPDC002913]
MSSRRLRVLAQGLPPESLTMTAMRNALSAEEYEEQARAGKPEEGRWSMLEQLVAGLTDAVCELQYITVVANSDGKGRKPKKPEPMRRPGVGAAVPRKRESLTDEHADFLFNMINGGGAA